MMDKTASKKRKLRHDDNHQEDANEEEKMEQFYALVRNIREARDRLMMSSSSHTTKDQMENTSGLTMRKLEEIKKPPVEVWKPTFQREDFLEDTKNPKNYHVSLAAGAYSQSKEGPEKEEIKEEIDLRLSL